MSQSERIFFILKLLDQNGGITTREIVQAFEVSERQAKRDIEYMRDRLGAPIVWRRESGCYEYSGPWQTLLSDAGFPDAIYRSAFHGCTLAMAIRSRKDGRFLMVNPAFERLSGKRDDELLGRDLKGAGLEDSELGRIILLSGSGKDGPSHATMDGRRFLVTSSAFECSGDENVLTLVLDVSKVQCIGKDEGVATSKVPQGAPAAGPGDAKGMRRILVVDDDDLVLDMMGCALRSFGYEPTLAGSGLQALESISREPDAFSLVILDIIMPGMDGFDLFNRMQLIRPGLPCLFISGYSPRPLDPYYTLPGVRGCLQKPIALSDLEAVLKKSLEADAGGNGKMHSKGMSAQA